MKDLFNYHRRTWDALKDYAGSLLLWIWWVAVFCAWAAGIIVVLGIASRLMGFVVTPLFRFGYDIVPAMQTCLNGACEMVLK